MSEQTSEALRAWFRQVEPMVPELFNIAHVICGNYDQAELALRGAILEVWADNADGGMGFREKLRGAVKREALDQLKAGQDADFTWIGFADVDAPAIQKQLNRESLENQRVLMLRHGVGLTAGRIAQLTGMTAAQVRSILERFESRCRRGLPAQDRSRFDALFSRLARAQLLSRTTVPRPGAIYRAFEAEASRLEVPERRISRVVYRVVVFLMALTCALLFWLFAVLVQSPDVETPKPSPAPAGMTIETVQAAEPDT